MKPLFTRFWKILLWLILIYASVHLARDILSDIFGIHNAFTNFGHRNSSAAYWCQNFCQWTTFPVEIFYIGITVYLLKKNKFSLIGLLIMFFIGIPTLLQYLDIFIK